MLMAEVAQEVPEEVLLFLRQHPLLSLAESGKVGRSSLRMELGRGVLGPRYLRRGWSASHEGNEAA